MCSDSLSLSVSTLFWGMTNFTCWKGQPVQTIPDFRALQQLMATLPCHSGGHPQTAPVAEMSLI